MFPLFFSPNYTITEDVEESVVGFPIASVQMIREEEEDIIPLLMAYWEFYD